MPAVKHPRRAVQLGVAARAEFILRIGQNAGQERAVDTRDDRKLGIGDPLALLRQVFGSGMGINAVDDGLEFTGADAEAHQYPHQWVQDTAAHDP